MDIQGREDDRQTREKEITATLAAADYSSESQFKHLAKFVKKMLSLSQQDTVQVK